MSDSCGSAWLWMAQIVVGGIHLRSSSDSALKGREGVLGAGRGWPVR